MNGWIRWRLEFIHQQFKASQPLQSVHHEYIKWLDKVEIGIHHPQPSPHPGFYELRVMTILAPGPYVSHQV
eukprot:scaffold65823_cov40-Cyclotella_meneghiniana.AAC.6